MGTVLFILSLNIVDSEHARGTVNRYLRALAISERPGQPPLMVRLNKFCLAEHSAALEALPRHKMAA
jgi:hypothetical protein